MKNSPCVAIVFPLFIGCITLADTVPETKTLPDGSSVMALSGHTSMIMSIDLSSDGKKVVTACSDRTIRIWDSESGKELHKLLGGGTGARFFPDGKKIVTFGATRDAIIWDAQSGEKLKILNGGGVDGNACFSPDGRRIALEVPDFPTRIFATKIWDADTGEELFKLEKTRNIYDPISFSPDGKKFVAVMSSGTVIYDISTGKELATLEAGRKRLRSVVFSTDGKKLLAVDNSQGETGITEVVTLDIDSKKVSQRIALGTIDRWAFHVADFSLDRTKIVTARIVGSGNPEEPDDVTNSLVQVWDTNSGKELQKWESPEEIVYALFMPEGKKILAYSSENTIRIYDTDSGNELKKLERPPDWIFNYALALSPDGKKVVMVGQVRKDNDAIVRTWILE